MCKQAGWPLSLGFRFQCWTFPTWQFGGNELAPSIPTPPPLIKTEHFGLPSSKIQSEMLPGSALRECGYTFLIELFLLSPESFGHDPRTKAPVTGWVCFLGVSLAAQGTANPSMESWKPIGHPSAGKLPDLAQPWFAYRNKPCGHTLLFFLSCFFRFCAISTGRVMWAIRAVQRKDDDMEFLSPGQRWLVLPTPPLAPVKP